LLKPGDEISLKEKIKTIPAVLDAIASVERDVPEYIEADHNKFSAKFVRVPSLDEVPYPVQMEPNLVVEYYSR
jgi:small subunit ribosomal protein S4